MKDIEIAAKVGYNSVELWLRDIRDFISHGGTMMDIKNRLDDLGLTFENCIAFTEWIVDDEAIRQRELNQFRKDLELLSELDCKRIAASPMGATNGPVIDLFRVAERYGVVLDIGKEYGITPVLEVWGHSANLHALGQAIFVAIESNHPNACLLLDIYHLHRGGSGYSGLRLLGHNAVPMFHFNDYPGNINRTDLTDADRVFPGDGSAPFSLIAPELKNINSEMVLSLELFNPDYWKMDALTLAKLGLQKMKKVVNS
ncbi:MAG: sugar phosphate isomerase/epimerase family protein [Bacteroidales bacterium]